MSLFTPTIKNKDLDFGSIENKARFIKFLKDNEGKVIEINLRSTARSRSQNSLYWLFLEVIERETGNNVNDLHELFRRTLLKPKVIQVLDREITIPRSTTELSKVEFYDYLDRISAKVDIAIPDTESYLNARDLAPLKNDKRRPTTLHNTLEKSSA